MCPCVCFFCACPWLPVQFCGSDCAPERLRLGRATSVMQEPRAELVMQLEPFHFPSHGEGHQTGVGECQSRSQPLAAWGPGSSRQARRSPRARPSPAETPPFFPFEFATGGLRFRQP
jgi:hypothetical protein